MTQHEAFTTAHVGARLGERKPTVSVSRVSFRRTPRGPWTIPQREVFTVQRLVANNADIIWHRTGASEGVNEAVSLGPGGG